MSYINDGKHIQTIVDTQPCVKHGLDVGTPCYVVYPGTVRGKLQGVCGSRIRRAGYVGEISATALQSKRASGGPRGYFDRKFRG